MLFDVVTRYQRIFDVKTTSDAGCESIDPYHSYERMCLHRRLAKSHVFSVAIQHKMTVKSVSKCTRSNVRHWFPPIAINKYNIYVPVPRRHYRVTLGEAIVAPWGGNQANHGTARCKTMTTVRQWSKVGLTTSVEAGGPTAYRHWLTASGMPPICRQWSTGGLRAGE